MSWALAGWSGRGVWPLLTVGLGGWLLAAVSLSRLRALARGRRLMAEAAHELRGSTTALTLAVEAVRRQPGGRRLVLILESELERLRAALDDLDAARDQRVRAPEGRVQPLDRAVRSAALGWRPAATRAGRPMHVRWEAGDASVRADRGRLAQALGNLLANAMEHGRGPVLLRARRRGPAVRVEITDRGTWGGRPRSGGANRGDADVRRQSARAAPEPQPRCEPEPEVARRDASAGHDRGHGLEIARRAVTQAGGSLTVESSDEGTTAAIELPVAER